MDFPEFMLAVVRWYHAKPDELPLREQELRAILKKIIDNKR